MNNDNSAFQTGLSLRRDMFDVGGADKAIDAATDFSRPLQEMLVRGAIAKGVSKLELRQLILHSQLYCGIPGASLPAAP